MLSPKSSVRANTICGFDGNCCLTAPRAAAAAAESAKQHPRIAFIIIDQLLLACLILQAKYFFKTIKRAHARTRHNLVAPSQPLDY